MFKNKDLYKKTNHNGLFSYFLEIITLTLLTLGVYDNLLSLPVTKTSTSCSPTPNPCKSTVALIVEESKLSITDLLPLTITVIEDDSEFAA